MGSGARPSSPVWRLRRPAGARPLLQGASLARLVPVSRDSEWLSPALAVLWASAQRGCGAAQGHTAPGSRGPRLPPLGLLLCVPGRGCWGVGRGGGPCTHLAHPAASGSIAPAGPEPGRPPKGGAARAAADPGPTAASSAPAVSAPPPWNSDPARRRWAGPRALKGAALFLGWDGAGASRRGAGPGPGPALSRGGTGFPGDSAGPEVPSSDRVHSPSLVSWEGVWAFLVAPPRQMVASPGEPHGLFQRGTQEEIGDRGCGVTSGWREWTSLGPINEAVRPWVAASCQQRWPWGWGEWLCFTPIQPLAPHQIFFVKP